MSVEKTKHHPLHRMIRPIQSWTSFLEVWTETNEYWHLESLLHNGFKVPFEARDHEQWVAKSIDRIIFYLEVATGWNDHNMYDCADGREVAFNLGPRDKLNVIRKSENDLRKDLATKAVSMLCSHFFKEIPFPSGEPHPDWSKIVLSEKLLPALLQFFKTETWSSYIRIPNLPRHGEIHIQQYAHDFLLNLCKVIWTWRTNYSAHFETSPQIKAELARINAAKPWTIEVLSAMEKLDILQERMLELDDACLAKLEEIALLTQLYQHQHGVSEDRKVRTLEEARFAGSKEAWLLEEYHLKMKMLPRLKKRRA